MNFDENLADFGCGLEDEASMSKNGAAFLKAYARTVTVFNHVEEAESEERKSEIVRNYLDFCYDVREGEDGKVKRGRNVVGISVSGKGFESITRPHLPNLEEGSLSTLYLVEFFTHCCINCIHSIEDVREVHEEIEAALSQQLNEGGFRGLKVISVHSPKFPREKDATSIKAFCTRMRMEHSEVVNDPECLLWNELGVSCWPTICILGPNPEGSGPNLLFNFMGEGQKDKMILAIKTAMEYFRTKLVVDVNGMKQRAEKNDASVDELDNSCEERSLFRFPGKVAVFGKLVVVSDSGNNRLVVLRTTGQVLDIIGTGRRGLRDGNFSEALFYNPQGLAFESESVFYVADTGNHAIRKVDLKSKRVSTLVESGRTMNVNDEVVSLKSPWDLTFFDADTLIVAAAGNHRLFGYFFNNKTLFGVEHQKNSFSVVAGSGREENRNNSYIMKASFAQPSGLTTSLCSSGDEKCIFIADSESSTIRSVTAKGQVVGVVGGSRDPTDLFAFGDADGKGLNVKLQHPMGVCSGASPSEIFIADTYNHKIKKIDVTTKECQTIISTGLNEPSGICKDSLNELLYVADTNNHSVKIIELKSGTMRKLDIIPLTTAQQNTLRENHDKCFELPINDRVGSTQLNFRISPMPDAFEGGQWKIASDQIVKLPVLRGEVTMNSDSNEGQFSLTLEEVPNGVTTNLSLTLDIFFCGPNSCIKRTRKIKVVCVKSESAPEEVERTLSWEGLTWEA